MTAALKLKRPAFRRPPTPLVAPRDHSTAVERVVTLPIRLISEANLASHEHWRERHRRAKCQRQDAARWMRALSLAYDLPVPPLVITIARLAPRSLDSDNLAASAKHVRDGIADWLGIDDGDPRIEWRYGQRKSPSYGVEVTIRRHQ